MSKVLRFLFIVSISSLLLFSCKNDPKEMVSSDDKSIEGSSYSKDSMQVAQKLRMSGEEVTPEKIKEILSDTGVAAKDQLPIACDLLKAKLVADEFDVREANIIVSDGKRRNEGNQNSRSCFWRWTGGGILIQVSQNPLPDEIPNWTEKYMSAKKMQGERNIEDGKPVKYKFENFNGPGTDNLYSHELGRYYSVYKDKYVVSLVFNGNMDPKKQLKISQKLLKSVFSNMG